MLCVLDITHQIVQYLLVEMLTLIDATRALFCILHIASYMFHFELSHYSLVDLLVPEGAGGVRELLPQDLVIVLAQQIHVILGEDLEEILEGDQSETKRICDVQHETWHLQESVPQCLTCVQSHPSIYPSIYSYRCSITSTFLSVSISITYTKNISTCKRQPWALSAQSARRWSPQQSHERPQWGSRTRYHLPNTHTTHSMR